MGTPVLGVVVGGTTEVINLQEPVVITLPVIVNNNEVYTRYTRIIVIVRTIELIIATNHGTNFPPALYADIHREQLPSMCVLELH